LPFASPPAARGRPPTGGARTGTARKAAEEDTQGLAHNQGLAAQRRVGSPGAYLARQDVLPPKVHDWRDSILGAALASFAPSKDVRC